MFLLGVGVQGTGLSLTTVECWALSSLCRDFFIVAWSLMVLCICGACRCRLLWAVCGTEASTLADVAHWGTVSMTGVEWQFACLHPSSYGCLFCESLYACSPLPGFFVLVISKLLVTVWNCGSWVQALCGQSLAQKPQSWLLEINGVGRNWFSELLHSTIFWVHH